MATLFRVITEGELAGYAGCTFDDKGPLPLIWSWDNELEGPAVDAVECAIDVVVDDVGVEIHRHSIDSLEPESWALHLPRAAALAVAEALVARGFICSHDGDLDEPVLMQFGFEKVCGPTESTGFVLAFPEAADAYRYFAGLQNFPFGSYPMQCSSMDNAHLFDSFDAAVAQAERLLPRPVVCRAVQS